MDSTKQELEDSIAPVLAAKQCPGLHPEGLGIKYTSWTKTVCKQGNPQLWEFSAPIKTKLPMTQQFPFWVWIHQAKIRD